MIFDQPEAFFTINYIPGFFVKGFFLTLAIGLVFVFFSLISYYFCAKKKINFSRIFIYLVLIFWSPIYLIYFYNNVYDFGENLKIFEYRRSTKKIVRFCNIDNYYIGSGNYCKMFSFITMVKKEIPENSELSLFSSPYIRSQLKYYFYPYVSIDLDAEYAIVYRGSGFYYKDGALYSSSGQKQGDYLVVSRLDGGLILKKNN